MYVSGGQIDGVLRRRQRAFTLVELMIAIALSLILLIGINAVFRMSGDTVGTGQQMLELQRQFRTFRNVTGNDFDRLADYTTAPSFIIESFNTPAFKDRYDQQATPGYNPTNTDITAAHAAIMELLDPQTGNSIYANRSTLSSTLFPTWAGMTQGSATYQAALAQIINQRNHRTDTLSFFARNPDLFRRQTSSDEKREIGFYQSGYRSSEAWITYGHVLQPDNDSSTRGNNYVYVDPTQQHYLGLGASFDPNTGKLYAPSGSVNQVNPNNFYSSQWILGRTSILLGDQGTFYNYVNPDSAITEPQYYVGDPTYGANPALPQNFQAIQALNPLSWGSKVYAPPPPGSLPAVTNPVIRIQHSQCDLAGETMAAIRDRYLHAEYDPTQTFWPRWYYPLVARGRIASDQQNNVPVWPLTNNSVTAQAKFGPEQMYRFFAKAWPDKSATPGNITSTAEIMKQELSLQVPPLLRGCGQFIVEYAGDYVTQQDVSANATVPPGTITDIAEDGQLDFDVAAVPGQAGNGPGTVVKRIRWYGMTRSLDGGQTVEDTSKVMQTKSAGAGRPPLYPQLVRPLYRYIQQAAYVNSLTDPAGGTVPQLFCMPFEKPVLATPTATYSGFPDVRPSNYVDSYTCAWGPAEINLDDMPKQASGSPMFPAYKILSNKKKFPSRSLLPWMIRITVRLDDPNNRLADGQTMEFIFNVNRPH